MPTRQEWSLFEPQEQIVYPTEQDIQELEENYENVKQEIQSMVALKLEIQAVHERILSALVSSKANRDYKTIKNLISQYKERLDEIIEDIERYETKYDVFLNLDSQIPEYLVSLREEYSEMIERATEIHDELCVEKQRCINAKKEMEEIETNSWDKAEALFQRDYYIMSIIAYYEAGNCPDIEIAYVCNVIENRIESPRFAYANNANDVVWAPGQYSPTWNSPMNETTPRVQKVVERYLRGEIDTEMPSDVLFQSLKHNDRRIWKHMSSGHYFCYG